MTELLDDLPEIAIEPQAHEQYIQRALFQLDVCCDGAISDDGMGFAGMHSFRGKNIAARLNAGKMWNVNDVKWIKKALPYYFNTQLQWVDKEYFFACCNALIEELEVLEIERETEQRTRQEKIAALSQQEKVVRFMAINADNILLKDRTFIMSLQSWIQSKKSWTPKQQVYVEKFLVKYGDFE